MEVALGQNARALRRDPAQVGDARLVDLLEGLEDRCYEQVAARVRLVLRLVQPRVGSSRLPLARSSVRAERVAQTVRLPHRLTELKRHARRAGCAPRGCRGRRAICARSTSSSEKCWKRATRSAKPSCSAGTSGFLPANSMFIPIRSACVIWCAITSCDRHVKTTVPGNGVPSSASK